MKSYLIAQYDSAKSFYNKAVVNIEQNKKELFSYNAPVCSIIDNKIILNDGIDKKMLFSNTTLRHIKEFLKQYYYNDDVKIAKKDLIKMMEG